MQGMLNVPKRRMTKAVVGYSLIEYVGECCKIFDDCRPKHSDDHMSLATIFDRFQEWLVRSSHGKLVEFNLDRRSVL
jgi:hypothetical protein